MRFDPPPAAIRDQLERLGRSQQLGRSKRLIRFLTFTIERVLEGQGNTLTEHTIGVAVYDRDPDFDPNVDGIVRAEAHRLRAKLQDYYRNQGRQDAILIEYPIGTYVPVFGPPRAEFLPPSGVVPTLMRSFDWSRTSLGPIASWPRNLRTILSISLRAPEPMVLFWGPELFAFVNDAAYEAAGADPETVGRKLSDGGVAWEGLARILHDVVDKGEPNVLTDELWLMKRRTFREECYCTATFSPVPESDGTVAGVLAVIADTTKAVISQRRLRTLNALGGKATSRDASEACRVAAAVLDGNRHDIPFAAIYLFDATRKNPVLEATSGVESGAAGSGPMNLEGIPLSDVVSAALAGRRQLLKLDDRLGPLPSGAWETPPLEIAVVPVPDRTQPSPMGFIVAGVNPHRRFDQDYRGFLENLAIRLSEMIAHARLVEQHQHGFRQTLELDRLRTLFLRSVGGALRTPLTVLLGTLSEVLESMPAQAEQRSKLVRARRNALQMSKIVTNALDFVRIRTGRMQPVYEPIDLGVLTAELAGMFRSTVQASDLKLVIDSSPLNEEVYIDRIMWEKTVLNLMLNAFQHTRRGEIGLSLHAVGSEVELAVWDTGSGIPAPELSRILEASSDLSERVTFSSEGSGMGLALTRHYLAMQGGRLQALSEVGKGSKFIVSVPRGKAHLPDIHIATASGMGASPTTLRTYVEEALRWTTEQALPADSEGWSQRALISPARGRIAVAAGDADLRDFVAGVLRGLYLVEVAEKRDAVLLQIQQGADLLILDEAMFGHDGVPFVRTVRVEKELSLPIILLSAVGTEENRLRALAAGADDYIVKPFTSSELLVRVRSQLTLAETRKKTLERQSHWRTTLETVMDQLPAGILVVELPSEMIVLRSQILEPMLGGTLSNAKNLDEIPVGFAFHLDGRPYTPDQCPLVRTVRTGETIQGEAFAYQRPHGQRVILRASSRLVRDGEGNPTAALLLLEEVAENRLLRMGT